MLTVQHSHLRQHHPGNQHLVQLKRHVPPPQVQMHVHLVALLWFTRLAFCECNLVLAAFTSSLILSSSIFSCRFLPAMTRFCDAIEQNCWVDKLNQLIAKR